MLKAKDIMNKEVITLSPSTTVEEAGRIFIEKKISGAPVVDEENKLIGIITENDLIRQNKRLHIPTMVRLFDAIIPLERFSRLEEEIRRMSAYRVSDICTKKVVTVSPDDSLQDIATIMSEKGLHLLPVISEGKIVGIIGKMDVIKGTLSEVYEQKQ